MEFFIKNLSVWSVILICQVEWGGDGTRVVEDSICWRFFLFIIDMLDVNSRPRCRLRNEPVNPFERTWDSNINSSIS